MFDRSCEEHAGLYQKKDSALLELDQAGSIEATYSRIRYLKSLGFCSLRDVLSATPIGAKRLRSAAGVKRSLLV
jgi:hypothetical protein